ncbi:MAG: glucose-6-phosphate isomerase [Clostridia bacterium]|nr:glucose-6-phosphate isomerase [Clostridia bacterium]
MRIDFNNMLDTAVGEHGITMAEVEAEAAKVPAVHAAMTAKKDEMAWRALPYNQDAIARDITDKGNWINDHFQNFVVLGIGGSALGSKALFTGTKHLRYNELKRAERAGCRFYVVDNVDPDGIQALFDIIDPAETCFHVISKSGNTVETMSQFMIVLHMLKETIGDDFMRNIVLTTDKETGILRNIANAYNMTPYVVPDGVGGRFSVLSPVGLVSAAVLGLDIQMLFEGARKADEKCTKSDLYENPAYMYAMLQTIAMHKGCNISVMMPYADGLANTAEWYAQLWAESLGKQYDLSGEIVHAGQTPVRALGVTDQHSQIQLYTEGPFDKVITFVGVENFDTVMPIPKPPIDVQDASYLEGQTLNKLIASELAATEYAVTQAGKMNMMVTLSELGPVELSEFLFFLEMATAAAGEFLGINAFDQPGVEAGKIATFALMGRSGYEEKAKELSSPKAQNDKFIFEL